MEHTIEQKAKILSNDRHLAVGIRVRYAAISKGIVRATSVDEKYINARYTAPEELVGV